MHVMQLSGTAKPKPAHVLKGHRACPAAAASHDRQAVEWLAIHEAVDQLFSGSVLARLRDIGGLQDTRKGDNLGCCKQQQQWRHQVFVLQVYVCHPPFSNRLMGMTRNLHGWHESRWAAAGAVETGWHTWAY